MPAVNPLDPFVITDAQRAEATRYARLLGDVVTALQDWGIPAEYWHSGGGIFTVHIVTGDYNWDFGSDGDWAWDYSHGRDGHITSGDLLDGDMIAVPDDTPARVVAQCIAHRLKKTPPPAR